MATTETNADECNGWANRETWAANLWLSNDAGFDTMTRERVVDAIAAYRERCDDFGFEPNDVGAMNAAGEAIRDLMDELLDDDGPFEAVARLSMARDIGSLWRVNWAEIAAAFAPEPVEAS